MCSTCGCSNTDKITYTKPGDKVMVETLNHHHEHEHEHGHHHGHHNHHHHNHAHSHDHHHHSIIELEQDILMHNNLIAERVKGYLAAKNIFAISITVLKQRTAPITTPIERR